MLLYRVSQEEKNKYRVLTHICGIQEDGTDETICRAAIEMQTQRTDMWTLPTMGTSPKIQPPTRWGGQERQRQCVLDDHPGTLNQPTPEPVLSSASQDMR